MLSQIALNVHYTEKGILMFLKQIKYKCFLDVKEDSCMVAISFHGSNLASP